MKTFEFFLDQKVTTWMRTEFEVKANDLNEAERTLENSSNGPGEILSGKNKKK
jgi:hypothetical protein